MHSKLLNRHYNSVNLQEVITSLWSGCGEIARYKLDEKSCVVKSINVPKHIEHPRIKQSQFAINRKQQSYEVEFTWYRDYSSLLPVQSRALECFNTINYKQLFALVFADFKEHGYDNATCCPEHILAIIKWLAYLHAFNLDSQADGLWQQGNYWHLSTRPDEFEKITEDELKQAAPIIASKIQDCPFQTLIHGDAKLANFAINHQTLDVLGYDFQYVGKGIGTVDLMYFLGSCLDEKTLITDANKYTALYYEHLGDAINYFEKSCDAQSVIEQWQSLWPDAWADFYRFLVGWSPCHWKINSYMLNQYQAVIQKINRK